MLCSCPSIGSENGTMKPVPAKALIPVLEPFPHRTVTPPTGPPPSHRPTSKLKIIILLPLFLFIFLIGRYKSPIGGRNLPPVSPMSDSASLGPRYEWTDVGMLDYRSDSKLYLVKRVHLPKDYTLPPPPPIPSSSDGSSSEESDEAPPASGTGVIQYWVPRIRLMFSAEDPLVFAERVSSAYKLRQETEALLRYHLYVDCMPFNEYSGSIDTDSLNKMTTVARSCDALLKPRYCIMYMH